MADGFSLWEWQRVFSVCVNVFDRFTWAKTISSKEPANVAEALDFLLRLALKMPKLITSANGNEFLGPVSALLTRKKSPNDSRRWVM